MGLPVRGFRVSGLWGFRTSSVLRFGFWGFLVYDLGFQCLRFSGLGCRLQVSGFRIQVVGFRLQVFIRV